MSLEHYEILETLGTGSFGTVSKIRRKADNKTLVWKEINFGGMSEKEKSQLVAEVNILRDLRNPFVVRYHDRIVDKPRTRLYIIMEYCAGGDLGKLIKRYIRERLSFDEKFIWKIFAQSIMALKECHRRQESNGDYKPILHRDLKPANILLDSDQNIKMGDFGLAKELNSQSTLAKTNVGTPFYMAPEIINEKDYDEKSDIWSLGCLLYELAALKPPFEAQNAVSLAMRINAGRFPRIPSKYSDALQDVIKLLLQVDPRRRPRVEDLENLPSVQPYITQARNILNEYRMNQNYAAKMREIKIREENILNKEETLNKIENILKEKEQQLLSLETKLKLQQLELQEKEQKLLLQQQQFQQQQQMQQHQERTQKRRSSFERYSIGGEMIVEDDVLLTYGCEIMSQTPVASNNNIIPLTGMMAATPNMGGIQHQEIIIPPDLSDQENPGSDSSKNSSDDVPPPPPSLPSTTFENPNAAVKPIRASNSTATIVTNPFANNIQNDNRKRGPVPLPSTGILTSNFQIFDENIPQGKGANLTNPTSKLQEISNKFLNSEKENLNPNSKLFRYRNANNIGGLGLNNQNNNNPNQINVQKAFAEHRKSYPNEYLFDNNTNSTDVSPMKKARYYQNVNNTGNNVMPTTVQVDLDALLRPRQQK